jgi:hypothetical protein
VIFLNLIFFIICFCLFFIISIIFIFKIKISKKKKKILKKIIEKGKKNLFILLNYFYIFFLNFLF